MQNELSEENPELMRTPSSVLGKKGVRKIYPEQQARSMIRDVTEYKAYLNWFEENISNSAP